MIFSSEESTCSPAVPSHRTSRNCRSNHFLPAFLSDMFWSFLGISVLTPSSSIRGNAWRFLQRPRLRLQPATARSSKRRKPPTRVLPGTWDDFWQFFSKMALSKMRFFHSPSGYCNFHFSPKHNGNLRSCWIMTPCIPCLTPTWWAQSWAQQGHLTWDSTAVRFFSMIWGWVKTYTKFIHI